MAADGVSCASKEATPGSAPVRPVKLFIGGLTRNTTTKMLREHFGKYGRILDCVAMCQPDGRPRGFGYVTLDCQAAAEMCLSEPQVVDNRVVDMKRAVPGSASQKGEHNRMATPAFQPGAAGMGQVPPYGHPCYGGLPQAAAAWGMPGMNPLAMRASLAMDFQANCARNQHAAIDEAHQLILANLSAHQSASTSTWQRPAFASTNTFGGSLDCLEVLRRTAAAPKSSATNEAGSRSLSENEGAAQQRARASLCLDSAIQPPLSATAAEFVPPHQKKSSATIIPGSPQKISLQTSCSPSRTVGLERSVLGDITNLAMPARAPLPCSSLGGGIGKGSTSGSKVSAGGLGLGLSTRTSALDICIDRFSDDGDEGASTASNKENLVAPPGLTAPPGLDMPRANVGGGNSTNSGISPGLSSSAHRQFGRSLGAR